MPKLLSIRTLVQLLAVYTASMAMLIVILTLIIAGNGDTGTRDALAIAAPFILLLCVMAIAAGFFATRMLRRGREKRAFACACTYVALPWPVMAALLY